MRLPFHRLCLQSFLLLTAYLVPVLISQPRRLRVTACTCNVEPEKRQRGILLYASSAAMHSRKNILRIGQALISGFPVPVERVRKTLRHAQSVIIHRPDGELREGISLLGKWFHQGDCHRILAISVMRNTLLVFI